MDYRIVVKVNPELVESPADFTQKIIDALSTLNASSGLSIIEVQRIEESEDIS